MKEEMIARFFETRGLGKVLPPVESVPGGFLHSMYRVRTRNRSYAVKLLNPAIMERPDAAENYRRAENLERILEEAGIPVIPAIPVNGRKMQAFEGESFYLFHWQNGSITDWHSITAEQSGMAGEIQGRIHALQPGYPPHTEPALCAIDWAAYIADADRQHSAIAPLLKENEKLLNEALKALNSARRALPDIVCITDEDMDPKNVIWESGKPHVIDLECLNYGNPVSSVLQLSLQWSGITTCRLRPELLRAFFEGYLSAWDNGFREYGSVLGLAYTWVEWLEFSIRRAIGKSRDEREREIGITETRNTLNRIRYIHEQEDVIRKQLDDLFIS